MAASLGVAVTVPKPYASLLSPPTTMAPYNPIGSGATGIPSPIEPPKNMTIMFVNLHGRNIEYAVASDTFVYDMRRVPHSAKKRARDRQLVNAATKPDVFVRLWLVNWRNLYQRAKPNKAGSLSWRGSN